VTLLHTTATSLNEKGLFPALLWSPVDTISITWTRIKNGKYYLDEDQEWKMFKLPRVALLDIFTVTQPRRVWGSRT